MLSMSLILGFLVSFGGVGAIVGWLIRLGIVPFIPVIGKVFELAFDLASIVVRGLGGALAKSFESVWGVLLLAVFFYAGAWHFADWRPWYGFTKAKAAVARTIEAPKAKVAAKATKQHKDTRSIFERNFNPFN